MLTNKKRFAGISLLFLLISHFILGQELDKINLANEYYGMGEVEKAISIYQDLAKNPKNIPLIHNNYFEIMINTGDFKSAEKYINDRIRTQPDNMLFAIDKGKIYERQGNIARQDGYFDDLFSQIIQDDRKLRLAAQYLIRNQQLEYAEKLYLEGRSYKKDPTVFALELATVYRMLNSTDKMVREYLNFVNQNPNNLPYVKNVLQNYLNEKEDLQKFEKLLYDLIQKDQNNDIYSDLIIWTNIQQRNFYGAFIQARAYDLRKGKDGNKILEVGMIALENKDYESALDVFEYLAKNYKQAYIYPLAKRYKIKAREELVKNTYPVDTREIRELANDYTNLVRELGVNSRTAEALLSKAKLHAFYLNEKDSAIGILNTIINIPRISPELKAQCKLDLGDIYLLEGEPWESALLYAQVEKSQKESQIGYEAKLRNAKLWYYRGDFDLAQENLDVLKEATTREISNDAIQLSLVIKDNSGLDTSDVLLKKYARVELMLFQNRKIQALDTLMEMYDHNEADYLADEILWLESKILMEMGEFQQSINQLDIIIEKYSDEIYGDDAFFRKAEIYDYHLKDINKAKELYQEFLKKYPGSVYAADARKRFRMLRGDYIN